MIENIMLTSALISVLFVLFIKFTEDTDNYKIKLIMVCGILSSFSVFIVTSLMIIWAH